MMSSSAVLRAESIASERVRTTMPGRAAALQDATSPVTPSTSTTQRRHEPIELTPFR